MSVELPENALYAPRMDLRVYDGSASLSAGLRRPLLGACSVDLGRKMAWNADAYAPPQMELFDDSEARRREEAREAEAEAAAAAADAADEAEDAADAGGGRGDDGGCVGVSFGGENGDDGDDEPDDEGDAVDQFELERRGALPVGQSGADTGVGAFDPMALDDLPDVYEDALYKADAARASAAAAAEDGGAGSSREPTFLDLVEARLANAVDVGALGEDGARYRMSDLPISFPTQWAAADYIEGREWWTNGGGGELENFLETKPFETYALYRGRYSPNPAKSTLRPVGSFKGIVRVLDEDPAFEEEPFFPMALLRSARYAVRVYVIRGANLVPAEGASGDPYLRVKLGERVEVGKRASKTLKPDFYETFEFRTTIPGPSTLKIQVKDHNRFFPVHETFGETRIDLEDRWYHRAWQGLDEREAGSTNKLKPIEVRTLRKDTSPVAQGQIYAWVEIRPEAETRREPAVKLAGPEKRKFEVRIICWKSRDVPYEMGDYFCQFWIGASRKQKTDVHWRCRNGKGSWNWRVKIPVELPLDSPELGRLSIQLWDQDIIKWNDIIGESQVDLYRWFLKAYHEKRSVNVFKEINEAIQRKKAEEMGLATESDLEDDDDGDDDGGGESEDDDDDAGDGEEDDVGGAAAEKTEEEGGGGDGGGETRDKEGEESKPLLAEEKEEKEDKEEDGPRDAGDAAGKDAEYFVKQLKEFVGLGEIDDSAQWIAMTYTDRKRNRVAKRGSLAITIEILPEDEIENRPAGHGRTEPNANPYLPPTTGRLSFSYNPLALCSALLGPKVAFQILCCLCCVLVLVAIAFGGMYFTSFYTVLESLGLTSATSTST